MYKWCDISLCGHDLFVIVFRITCTSGMTYLYVACLVIVIQDNMY